MSNKESYSKNWVRLNLMVNPETDEVQAVGGDRESGEGDTPYSGMVVLERLRVERWMRDASQEEWNAFVDAFARRHTEVLEELKQIHERRNDAVKIIEQKRARITELEQKLKEVSDER